MAIKQTKFVVTNRRPLLMHNPEKLMKRPEVGTRKKIPTPEEEAELASYRLPHGQLFLKGEMFRGAMLKAATGLRVGKTSAKTVLAAGCFVTSEQCPLVDPYTDQPLRDYVIDTRRAVVQGQGVLRSRPRIDKWKTTIEIEYDDEVLKPPDIHKFLERAGLYAGVGDQRPGAPKTPGPFGTFSVSVPETADTMEQVS